MSDVEVDIYCDKCTQVCPALTVVDLTDIGYQLKLELCATCFRAYTILRAQAQRELNDKIIRWFEEGPHD